MKLHILGTLCGMEPLAGRNHTSFVIEAAGGLYWFDAGEGCSRTAHLMGLDLLSTRKIIISHSHMDHVGGLGNLLWNIRKLRYVSEKPVSLPVEVWLPQKETYEGFMQVLMQTEGGFVSDIAFKSRQVKDGPLFDDGALKVSAMHNLHLGQPEDDIWRSFSYRIECEGHTIVYSGDCKSSNELLPLLPCDILMIETGHHKPVEAAALFRGHSFSGLLLFIHHGRIITGDFDNQLALVRAEYPNSRFANDGDTFDYSGIL